MRMFFFPFLLALASPGAAQAPPRAAPPPVVTVRLDSFDFTPGEIHLRGGRPVLLRLLNESGRRHNFSAPAFFAAAAVAAGQPRVAGGEIEVPPHGRVEILLTPARGGYELECSHSGHALLGMEGMIVVE